MRYAGFVFVLCVAAAFSASALAGPFTFDFEAPTYSGSDYPGTQVIGQDGWYVPNAGYNGGFVATSGSGALTAPLAGAQSVIIDPVAGSGGVAIVLHKALGAGYQEGSIMSALIKPNGADVTTLGASVGTNADGFAGIRFNSDGTVHCLSSDPASQTWTTVPQIGTYTVGDVFDVVMTLSFTGQSYTIAVTDQTNPAGSFTTGAIAFRNYFPNTGTLTLTPAMAEEGDILFGTVGNGGAVFDNFAVTSVPEPSTLMLLVTGLIGLLAYAWRKRK
jgi:hypothetical protein